MNQKKANFIEQRISACKTPVIFISKPVDADCMGTAIAYAWWMDQYNASKSIPTKIVSFYPLETLGEEMPLGEKVAYQQIETFDFDQHDLYVLVDGGDWKQFFTQKWKDHIQKINKNKFVHIDHHQEGNITAALGERSLRVIDCCTAKVVYDYFMKPSGFVLNEDIATCLYKALISDTGNFRYQMYPDTFAFANELYSIGVDHERAVHVYLSRQIVDYTQWAIEQTRYYTNIKTTLLIVERQNREMYAQKFPINKSHVTLDRYYKSIFMTMVKGYPYSIIFEDFSDVGIKTSWRTKTGSPIKLKRVFESIGFEAGGHRNAGGGFIHGIDMQTVLNLFLEAMNEQVQQVDHPDTIFSS